MRTERNSLTCPDCGPDRTFYDPDDTPGMWDCLNCGAAWIPERIKP